MGERAHSGVDVPSRAVDSRFLIKDSHAYQGIPEGSERRDSFEVRGLICLVADSDMAGYGASLFVASLIKCKVDTLNFIPCRSGKTLINFISLFLHFFPIMNFIITFIITFRSLFRLLFYYYRKIILQLFYRIKFSRIKFW